MLLYARYLAAEGQVSTDSRQPQPGTLFFALNGPQFRGVGLPLPQALLVGPEMAAAAAAFPQAQHLGTKAEAAGWLRQHPVRGQQVLVKGSRGLALEMLVELL